MTASGKACCTAASYSEIWSRREGRCRYICNRPVFPQTVSSPTTRFCGHGERQEWRAALQHSVTMLEVGKGPFATVAGEGNGRMLHPAHFDRKGGRTKPLRGIGAFG